MITTPAIEVVESEFNVIFPFLHGLRHFQEDGGYWDGSQLTIQVTAGSDRAAVEAAIAEVMRLKEEGMFALRGVAELELVIPRTVRRSPDKPMRYFGLLSGPSLIVVRAYSQRQALWVWRGELGQPFEPDGVAEVQIKYRGRRPRKVKPLPHQTKFKFVFSDN